MPLIPAIEDALIKHRAQIEENKRFYGNTYDQRYLDYVCVEENGKIVSRPHDKDFFLWFQAKIFLTR